MLQRRLFDDGDWFPALFRGGSFNSALGQAAASESASKRVNIFVASGVMSFGSRIKVTLKPRAIHAVQNVPDTARQTAMLRLRKKLNGPRGDERNFTGIHGA